ASGVTHCQTVRRAAACRAPRGGSVCVGTTSNGSCAADPCGSLASTPAGVPVSTTTTSTTTTTTEVQKQCCGSAGGAFVGECVAETACDANHPLSVGPGSCSPNPCPPNTTMPTTSPTTTAPGATTTTTTGAAPTSTTSTATTRPPTTTTTLLTCSGVFPRCGGSCPVGKHCRPFGRTKSCVCR